MKQPAKRACVIGWPIKHSRSPIIHTHWLKQYGIEGTYEKVAVAPEQAAEWLEQLADHGFAGCNVTVPHKETAFQAADRKEASAEAVQAANTLWLEDGKLRAANTDTYGFMAHLEAEFHQWKQEFAGPERVALVLGAGGAARAIVHGLIEAGLTGITVSNRTLARAQSLAEHFNREALSVTTLNWEERQSAVARAGLIINTTTIGMNGDGALGLDLTQAPAGCIVADIVYVPLETGLLRDAKASGLRTLDGLGMLLHQAVPGFEKWFGVRPDVTKELRDAVLTDLAGA